MSEDNGTIIKGGHGVLEMKFNLVCEHGHRAYAPDASAWLFVRCGAKHGCTESVSLIPRRRRRSRNG